MLINNMDDEFEATVFIEDLDEQAIFEVLLNKKSTIKELKEKVSKD